MDNETLDHLSSMSKALASRTRLRIFTSLPAPGGPLVPVHTIAKCLDIKPSTMSKHLGILDRAGLVTVENVSQYKKYTQNWSTLQGLIDSLQSLVPEGAHKSD